MSYDHSDKCFVNIKLSFLFNISPMKPTINSSSGLAGQSFVCASWPLVRVFPVKLLH